MEIRPYTTYLATEILPLYRAVGWSNYYERPDMLRAAFQNSLSVLAAYDGDDLAGIIRAVGDGHSVLLIQDILVYPEYQHRGIGTALMKTMIARYPHVYQTELATDNTPKTISFYKSLGFTPLQELGCCGFMKTER